MIRALLPLMMVACQANEIREQAEETHTDRRVLGIYPSHGAMALRGDISVQVVLGEDGQGTTPNVHFIGPGQIWSPECDLIDDGGQWVSCRPIRDVPRDEVFDLEIGFSDGNPLMVTPTSEFPDIGPAYLLNNATITRFGGNERTIERIGELFKSSDITGVIVDYTPNSGAMDTTFVAGPIDYKSGAPAMVRAPGLTFAMPIHINEKGHFNSVPTSTFLPIFVDTEFVQVLIQNCKISGTVVDQRIEGFRLSGTIPAASLVQLVSPLGPAGNMVLNNIEMNVDTDDDGEVDSIEFSVVGRTPEIELVRY